MTHPRPFLRRGPSGPLADKLGLVHAGYDETVEDLTVPASLLALFPRNVAGDPIRVVIPNVVPGNTLEVDFRLNLGADLTDYYPNDIMFSAVAVVTFDGTTAFPGTFSFVMNSWGSSIFGTNIASQIDRESLSGLAAVTIPAGATTATVEIAYVSNGPVVVEGLTSDDVGLSASLRVYEIGSQSTAQIGPGVHNPVT